MAGEAIDGASADVHRLAVGLSTFKRLLDRRGPDGELVPADPALIRMAVRAMRAELRRVGDDLAVAADDPAAPDQARAQALGAAAVKLDEVLTILETAVDEADG